MDREGGAEPFKTSEKATPAGKMTYEEFLTWADEDTWAEWVNGEVIILTPASKRHQDLAFLAALLRFFVEARQIGFVVTAPFQVKIGPDLPGREPDIIFIAQEHLNRLRDTYSGWSCRPRCRDY
jgi:Uma2 family endonuclease